MRPDNPGRLYFKFIEHYNENTRTKWIYLVDAQDVIWGLFSNYKRAKDAVNILWSKYSQTLLERGLIVKE